MATATLSSVRSVFAKLYPAIVMVIGLGCLFGGFALLLGEASTSAMRVVGLVLIVGSLLVYSFSYRIGRWLFGDVR